MIISFQDERED